jgi:hypothetical protein
MKCTSKGNVNAEQSVRQAARLSSRTSLGGQVQREHVEALQRLADEGGVPLIWS